MKRLSTTFSTLESFPFLTLGEFRETCYALVGSVEGVGGAQAIGWHVMELLQQGGVDVLRILKRIRVDGDDSNTHAEQDEGEIDEIDDPEALAPQLCSSLQVEVEYNIIRSTTYQVPVLYFFLRSIPPHGPQGIQAVYRYLVPSQLRTVLGSVGVMGGISIDYHPTLSVPVYFVHPCNTSDALRDVGDGLAPTTGSYLPLWLGLVGNSVSLHLPGELLAGTSRSKT
ncbi:hypothetical protein FQN54_000687 [Arachnomyces sp. PD_36]|nr:hypothetical protein FQN54_000687 [Arachnomyces sp. PD_36]